MHCVHAFPSANCVQAGTHVHTNTSALLHSHMPHVHATESHTDDSTHKPFLSSQLCSDIKQSQLRGNKHTDEERGCQAYTHARILDACAGSPNKLTVLQEITKAA